MSVDPGKFVVTSLIVLAVFVLTGRAPADEAMENDPNVALEEHEGRSASTAEMTQTRHDNNMNTAPDESQRARWLPEVVVTPADDEESLYRTPIDYGGARNVIPPAEIQEAGALNTQEILRQIPSTYFFEETGTDSKPNIAVRGVTSGSEGAARSANVSLMADGIPLAPAPYGHAGQSLFPFTMERVHAIDVIRGGHTVKYGSNTVSGVINYLTRPIPMDAIIDQQFSYNEYGDFSTYTASGGTHEKVGVLTEAVYKTGDTYREHGDYTIQNYAAKVAYQFSENVRGMFQYEYFKDESDLAGGLSLEAFREDPFQSLSQEDRFEGDQSRGNFRVEWTLDEQSHIDFIGYIFGGDRTFYLGKPRFYGSEPNYIDATPRPMTVWALQPQYTRQYDFGSGTGEVTTGVRYHEEDITRRSERIFPDNSVLVRSNNQYTYSVWSGFVENTFNFDKLSLTPGLRLESVDIDGKNELTDVSVNRDFVELIPAINGSYMVREHWSLYGNVQRSFLPPQANHVEISDKPQNLEGQYGWQYEVGSRGTLWDGLISPDLTFYLIDYRNRIERDPDQGDVFVNRGNTRHQGVEFTLDSEMGALNSSLEGLTLTGMVSYNDSEYRNGEFEGNQVPYAPHWLAYWGASYHHRTGLWSALDGYFVGSAYSDSENTEEISAQGTRGKRPSYTVWNLRGGYDLELAKNVELQLQVGCRNIFDEEYFEVRAGKGLLLGIPRGIYSTLGIAAYF